MTTTLTDDYGRKVVFEGERLVAETTDTQDGRKPQWLDMDIWRTDAGNYVVQRSARYRVVHARENCSRAEGYDLKAATDTYPCTVCNPDAWVRSNGRVELVRPAQEWSGWVQLPRITVDVFKTPEELIESLRVEGRHTRLARSILADLSEQDDRIEALWNEVVVP